MAPQYLGNDPPLSLFFVSLFPLMADNEVNRWISSTETMLGLVNDHRVKASSISIVPEQLRESRKEAYEPKVVSIGPLHRGTTRELLYMEEIKWRCMRSLLHRTPEREESLKKCWKAIYALDEVVRATYANDIKFNSYDLAKIMLLDGCFLLELLMGNEEESDKAMKSGLGAGVGKMKLVQSDLKLLENQIPIFVLVVLFQNLFPNLIPSLRKQFRNLFPDDTSSRDFIGIRKIVNGLALFLFGCSSDSRPVDSPNCAHFLELTHRFMTNGIGQENNSHLSMNCATSLEAARAQVKIARLSADRGSKHAPLDADRGSISIIRLEDDKDAPQDADRGSMRIRLEDDKEVPFGSEMKFSDSEGKRKLEIQPLHIEEMTEVQWRNLIAWEQNRITHEKFLLEEENRTPCKFSQYALLFKDLVCCEHDIQLLRDRKVLLVDNGKRSNEDLKTFLDKIAIGIQIDASGDGRFGKLNNELNRRILWHRCRCFATSTRYWCRDSFDILKREYTPTVWKTMGVVAAIVLLDLTMAQTVLAAIAL